MFTFTCNKCNEEFEFGKSKSLPRELQVPEDLSCPKCKIPDTLIVKATDKIGIRVSHDWKHGKSVADIAAVYADESINPY